MSAHNKQIDAYGPMFKPNRGRWMNMDDAYANKRHTNANMTTNTKTKKKTRTKTTMKTKMKT